jgi:hypothetical protein
VTRPESTSTHPNQILIRDLRSVEKIMEKHIPKPLTAGHLCEACRGTGADIKKTLALKSYDAGYIMCRVCNGNGLDPAEYFRWS